MRSAATAGATSTGATSQTARRRPRWSAGPSRRSVARASNYRDFRPPGGELNDWTAAVLREHGFEYVSPGGRRVAASGGLVALPFRWKAIDAYYFFDAFAPLRASCGDPEDTLAPSRFIAGVRQVLDEIVATAGYVSLLFHPFLHADEAHFGAMRQIIETVARRADIWCATCAEHADWVLRHPELLAADPELETTSWR